MDIKEILTLLLVGLLIGIILIAFVSKKEVVFDKAINGLLFFGGTSLALTIIVLVLKFQLIPVKAVISIIFFGIPTFSAGTVMKAYSIIRNTNGRQNDGPA
jgi:hypothetical protein